MSGARWLSVLFVLLAPAAARAQLVGMNIELFGTVGVVGGVTPVQVASGSHLDSHAGIRLDGGMQIARVGLGAGLRYWEMTPTEEYGGSGLDLFFLGEWRPGNSLRTTVRASYGIGFDDIDSGRSQASPTISTVGDVSSVGVGHEVIVFSGARFICPPICSCRPIRGLLDADAPCSRSGSASDSASSRRWCHFLAASRSESSVFCELVSDRRAG